MSDKIIISDEKQFVYRYSFNKGIIHTPSMVESCLGLSNDAKTVYSNILNHIYEKGYSAFPSTYKLAISCSCSVNSVVNYINELVDKGFIVKESRGRGRSNNYYVRDCNEVPLLRVSEMFWKCMSELTGIYGWKKMLVAKDKILKFMEDNGYRLQDMDTDETTKEQLTKLLKHVLEGGRLDVGLLPKSMKYQKPSKPVEQTEHVQEVKEESKQEEKPKKRNVSVEIDKNHWRLLDISQWKVKQFKEYFYDKYLDLLGQPHPRNEKKHTGQLRRVLDNLNGDKELLKKYIDASFEIGYDNMTLDYFCSASRLGEIQTYLVNGKRPFYLEKNKSRSRIVNEPTEEVKRASGKDALNKLLGGGK